MLVSQTTTKQKRSFEGNVKLRDTLMCPTCRDTDSNLTIESEIAHCSKCQSRYPVFVFENKIIPWLYEHTEFQLLDWHARLKGFLYLNDVEQQRLKDGLNDKRLSKLGQNRIRKLLNAKSQQREQVLSLLEPYNFQELNEIPNNIVGNLHSKTPKIQGLTSYYDNIFRDWAWNNDENDQMLESLECVIDTQNSLGNILTIGSGAGRLSYDLHQKYSASFSLLLDINPLLMSAACNAIQGVKFELNEFPIAPLNKNSFFSTQHCSSPQPITENFEYLLADGMNPPVKDSVFDTVLTPWLIDIIPQNFREYVPRINRCLKNGGVWLNTGSLAFFHKKPSWCYSEEEIIEIIEKSGFEITKFQRSSINYMQSPLSAHGRTESVFSFSARKLKDVNQPKKYEYLPDWIRNTSESIPKHYDFEISASKFLLQAQVLSAIDGKRSIETIGKLVAKQYNLKIDESIHAVRQIMVDSIEEN